MEPPRITRRTAQREMFVSLGSYDALLQQIREFNQRGGSCHRLQNRIGAFLSRSGGQYASRQDAWAPFGLSRRWISLPPLPSALPSPLLLLLLLLPLLVLLFLLLRLLPLSSSSTCTSTSSPACSSSLLSQSRQSL